MLKILWFTNTVASADKFLNQPTYSGGWVKALNEIISNKVELNIAFYSSTKRESFKYNNTTYFPIPKNVSLRRRFLKNYFKLLEPKSDIYIFLEIIHKVNPDIIHIHGTENPFGLITNKIDIPVIISIQGIVSVIVNKYFSGMQQKHAKLKFGIKNIILWKSYYSKYLILKKMKQREQKILKSARFVIGRTNFDEFVTKVLAPSAQYFKINEVLRANFYKYNWKYKNTSRFVIFTTTNPEFYKGLELIAETISILTNYDVNFIWKIAGISGNHEIIRTVNKIVHSNKWLEHAEFLGMLPENQLIESLLTAQIYVMPSHIENSPNSLCEALLLGIPAISTSVGGTNSLIKHNENGILIQENDPYSLSGAILDLLSNTSKMQEFSQKARESSYLRHDTTKIANDLISLYQLVFRSQD